MTTMQKIEAVVGKVTGWDGRLVLWAGGLPRDLRDVLPKGMSLGEAVDALDEYDLEASKARKAAVKAAKEAKEEAQ
jgi:hypothetical protein